MNDDEDSQRTDPRILVVDLETTGLNAERHSIVQVGAVWISGAEGEFSMDCRMHDAAAWTEEAAAVNGLSEARCTDPKLPTESEAIAELLRWIHESAGMAGDPSPVMLAGLNPSFDRAFIHACLKRSGAANQRPFPHRVLDLHTLAVCYAIARGEPVPSRGYYTDEIYALLDLPPEPRPHCAIVGARREAEAMRMLLGIPEIEGPLPYEILEEKALNPLDCAP